MMIPKINSKSVKVKESSFNPLLIECPPTDNINTAEIAIVGEAPSDIELLKQEPFVGPTGSQLNRICAACRIARYQIYMTNACKAKLPGNNSDKLWTAKGYRHPAWGELQIQLIEELSQFQGKVILLLGATPMKLLIDEAKFDSITKYRGSFYPAENFPHLKDPFKGKIIGLSFHPSFTLQWNQPIHFYTMIADFSKAMRIVEDPCLLQKNIPKIHIAPKFQEVMNFYNQIKEKNEDHRKIVAYDIEATPEFITCFSLAFFHDGVLESMSIPLMNNQGNYWTVEEEIEVWRGLAEILGDPDIRIIAQNAMFDCVFTLRTVSIKTNNLFFDTMIAQHLCYTELPKSLDYLTSIYTYYPYYKDEGKQAHLKVIKDWYQYWAYNAKDSAYLLPISEHLFAELEEFECIDAMEYSMNLHKPLIEMEYNGFLVDIEGVKKTKAQYEKRIRALQHGLNKITGQELNPGSSKQMIAYFYGICMIKPYINRKTGNATCDTVALHRIAKKKGKGSIEARMIIKIRKYNKLVSTYFNVPVDEDKRLRCSHKITGTVSGRIATERTFFGTGTNLQNQPYIFKYFLISDPDWILCECDLAKAEAHVVAFLTQDANMIKAFESGIDVHSFNASKIFNVPIEQVIHEAKTKKSDQRNTMRYMGKKVVHACLDKETEILTRYGWLKVKHFSGKEAIAIWNPLKQEITFEIPKYWNLYNYEGSLLLFEGQTLSQLVTPEHKIPRYISGQDSTTKNNCFRKDLAKDLIEANQNIHIPVTGYYQGELDCSNSLIKLAIAIQTNGFYEDKRINFHLKNKEKIDSLIDILSSLKIKFILTEQSNNSVYFSFLKSPLTDYFITNNQFNWNLLVLSAKNLDCFLDEILYWNNTNKRMPKKFQGYTSTKKQNCIIVSTIAHLRGRQGILQEVKKDSFWAVTFNTEQKVKSKFTQYIDYKDQVYCPTVSTGCFLIRRNDIISITSNSNYNMGPQTFSDQLAVEEIFKSQSECKQLLQNYTDRFPGLKRWHRQIEDEVSQTRILYNLFNRPRRFLGPINPALFRNAYSYKPQSTVAELLNRGMIKCVNDSRLGKAAYDIKFLTTVHDSVIFQFHKSKIPNLLQILLIIQDHMTHTFTYKGKSFTIGLDAKIGHQWAGKTAEIASFTQAEIDTALKKIEVI